MAAQKIIQRGMRWQVGDGNKIRVWHDSWIPRPTTHKVLTPEIPQASNALVCELINRATNEWNKGLIERWFLPEDREAILSIPLSSTSTQDRVVWAVNNSGKFTVKSAYVLALEESTPETMADCSDESTRSKLWKSIWRMKTPQKIKHFAWRAGRNILATKSNLTQRRIISDGTCDLCGQEQETVCHLLWTCDHAKEVWRNSKFALPFEILSHWSFLDVVAQLQSCDQFRPGQLEQFISVCWGIWKNRNDLRMGGKGRAGRTVLKNAIHLVEEFRAVNEAKTEHQMGPEATVSWKPPSHGFYKINLDGAVFLKNKQAGAGVIIRNEAGEVIAALSKKWKWPLGALEAEAKALEAGVEFARDVGISEAEFESDSLVLCNAVQGLISPPVSVLNVLAGVMNQLSRFRQWSITHIKRQGNVPAHLLAQYAKDVEDYVAWLEEYPSLIEHACMHDRNVPG